MLKYILCFAHLLGALLLSSQEHTIIDARDGQSYKIFTAGTLEWFGENLKYRSPGSKYYDNDSNHLLTYGRLYSFKEAKSSCPEAWRLPTLQEWRTFYKENSDYGIYSFMSQTDSLWHNKVNYNINDSGFSALPGGMIKRGKFTELGISASFWAKRKLPFINHPHFHIYGMHQSSMKEYTNEDISIPKNAIKLKNIENTWLLEKNKRHMIYKVEGDSTYLFFSHTPHAHTRWKDRYLSVRCVRDR